MKILISQTQTESGAVTLLVTSLELDIIVV